MTEKGNIGLKINFDGKEVSETRMTVNNDDQEAFSSAYGEVHPKKDEYALQILGDINKEVSFHADKDLNFNFGALSFPKGAVVKHRNTAKIDFIKGAAWSKLENFETVVNLQDEGNCIFFVLYNLSFATPARPEKFHLRIRTTFTDKTPHIPMTTATSNPGDSVALSAYFIWQGVCKTSYKFGLEYKNEGEALSIDGAEADPHYVQAMEAMQLPSTGIVHLPKITTPVVLNTGGEWKTFGFNFKVKVECQKTILVLYNVNLKIGGKTLSTRVRFGNKFSKKTVMTTSGSEYGHISGFTAKPLKEGEYDIELEYKCDAEGTFTPDQDETDSQVALLQIVLFD